MNLALDPDIKVVLPDGSEHRLIDYLLPSALLMVAALLLMISMLLPYWRLRMTRAAVPERAESERVRQPSGRRYAARSTR